MQFVMGQQESHDVAADSIQARLSKAILENYNKFIDGMKFVQEVDMDISRAEITVGNILRKLRSVRSGFVSDALKTLRLRRRRDRLLEIQARVSLLKACGSAPVVLRSLCNIRSVNATCRLLLTLKKT